MITKENLKLASDEMPTITLSSVTLVAGIEDEYFMWLFANCGGRNTLIQQSKNMFGVTSLGANNKEVWLTAKPISTWRYESLVWRKYNIEMGYVPDDV